MEGNTAPTIGQEPHPLSHQITMEEEQENKAVVNPSCNNDFQNEAMIDEQVDDSAKAQVESWVETQTKIQSEPEAQHEQAQNLENPESTTGMPQAIDKPEGDALDSSRHDAATSTTVNATSDTVQDTTQQTAQSVTLQAPENASEQEPIPGPAQTSAPSSLSAAAAPPPPATVSSVLGGGYRGGRTRAGSTPTGPSIGPSRTSTTPASHGLVPQFVAPSSYLRRRTSNRSAMAHTEHKPLSPLDRDQLQGLNAIREFLKVRTSYDVLPLSFRLVVLDNNLLIKKSLSILIQNTIVSAPLWDSKISRFAGILTSTDFINVIQYYCQFPDEIGKLDQFRLSSLRDIEKAIGAVPIETVSVHPSRPLYEACRRMLKTRARRIPLIDVDSETGREMVVSVITQYRILKFIAVNNEHNTMLLKKTVRDIGLGSYTNLATARMSSSVLDVVHLMVDHNISCIPIVDSGNRVLNVFEAVDVIPSIKDGAYEELDHSVGEALCKRPEDSPGIYTCSEFDRLDSIFDTVRKSRVHRLIVVDDDNRLKGIISLSDILKYVLLYGLEDTTI